MKRRNVQTGNEAKSEGGKRRSTTVLSLSEDIQADSHEFRAKAAFKVEVRMGGGGSDGVRRG